MGRNLLFIIDWVLICICFSRAFTLINITIKYRDLAIQLKSELLDEKILKLKIDVKHSDWLTLDAKLMYKIKLGED